MTNYKDCKKIYLGGSDSARLQIISPKGKDYLKFIVDGDYKAYIADETTEIPEHYHEEYRCNDWIEIYNDDPGYRNNAKKFYGKEIILYRAGDFGCIVQVIEKSADMGDVINPDIPDGWYKK